MKKIASKSSLISIIYIIIGPATDLGRLIIRVCNICISPTDKRYMTPVAGTSTVLTICVYCSRDGSRTDKKVQIK